MDYQQGDNNLNYDDTQSTITPKSAVDSTVDNELIEDTAQLTSPYYSNGESIVNGEYQQYYNDESYGSTYDSSSNQESTDSGTGTDSDGVVVPLSAENPFDNNVDEEQNNGYYYEDYGELQGGISTSDLVAMDAVSNANVMTDYGYTYDQPASVQPMEITGDSFYYPNYVSSHSFTGAPASTSMFTEVLSTTPTPTPTPTTTPAPVSTPTPTPAPQPSISSAADIPSAVSTPQPTPAPASAPITATTPPPSPTPTTVVAPTPTTTPTPTPTPVSLFDSSAQTQSPESPQSGVQAPADSLPQDYRDQQSQQQQQVYDNEEELQQQQDYYAGEQYQDDDQGVDQGESESPLQSPVQSSPQDDFQGQQVRRIDICEGVKQDSPSDSLYHVNLFKETHAKKIYRNFGKVICSFQEGASKECTGVMVGKQIVLTAANCLFVNTTFQQCDKVQFKRMEFMDDKFQLVTHESVDIQIHRDYLDYMDDESNVGLVILEDQIGDIPIFLDTDLQPDCNLNICGFCGENLWVDMCPWIPQTFNVMIDQLTRDKCESTFYTGEDGMPLFEYCAYPTPSFSVLAITATQISDQKQYSVRIDQKILDFVLEIRDAVEYLIV